MGTSNRSGEPAPPKDEDDEQMEAADAAQADGSPSDGSGSPDAGAPAPFSEGEKVLAFHGPRIYEAKIQKAEVLAGKWKFFVHYLGWNKSNWDEWVPASRLLKFTDENVRKQQELVKESQPQEKSGKSRSSQKPSKTDVKPEKEDAKNQGSKGKKRKSAPPSEEKEKEKKPQESPLMLQFPLTLKKQLVDDSEFVTQLGKLVKLPRSPNVDDIFKKYLEYRTKKDGMINESVAEILKGLRCYFDKALPVMLLYSKEKAQYNEIVKEDVSPSTIYGAEHLLRLFVKLPELLPHVNMEEEALTKLQQKLLDFLKFMQKNQSLFFLSSYDTSKASVKPE